MPVLLRSVTLSNEAIGGVNSSIRLTLMGATLPARSSRPADRWGRIPWRRELFGFLLRQFLLH